MAKERNSCDTFIITKILNDVLIENNTFMRAIMEDKNNYKRKYHWMVFINMFLLWIIISFFWLGMIASYLK